jgi:hypothetical protein|tara:strand:- start:660 stop:860 length:201 start_codon:yes stop_codon:yes gene_type:complete
VGRRLTLLHQCFVAVIEPAPFQIQLIDLSLASLDALVSASLPHGNGESSSQTLPYTFETTQSGKVV